MYRIIAMLAVLLLLVTACGKESEKQAAKESGHQMFLGC